MRWCVALLAVAEPSMSLDKRRVGYANSVTVPVTSLGRLVKDGKIKSMEEIYLFSLPIKEYQVVDILLPKLTDEVMKITPCLLYTSPSPRDQRGSRMPSSA